VKTIEEILEALILFDNQPVVKMKADPPKAKSPIIT